MEIEINSNLNHDEEIKENDEIDDENGINNANNNNNIDHRSLSNKVYQENKISLCAKSNIKFALFCDLLEKCLKEKSKVKSQ